MYVYICIYVLYINIYFTNCIFGGGGGGGGLKIYFCLLFLFYFKVRDVIFLHTRFANEVRDVIFLHTRFANEVYNKEESQIVIQDNSHYYHEEITFYKSLHINLYNMQNTFLILFFQL